MGRQMGLGDMGMNVSASQRSRLRALPAYRRYLLGFRLLLLGPVLLGITLLLVAAGVRGGPLAISLVLTFGPVGVGVILLWSAAFPLIRHQRAILPGMSEWERSNTVRWMAIRDLFRPLSR